MARLPLVSQRPPVLMEIGGRQRVVRYAHTLGEHPGITRIIRSRIDMAIAAAGVTPDQVAIALIGHSTQHNPESRKAIEAQVMLLRGAVPVREVVALYLDGTPDITDVYSLTTAPYIIAVPLFLAVGLQVSQAIPEALGIPVLTPHPDAVTHTCDESPRLHASQVGDRTVIYTQPIGTKVEISRMIVDLAGAAGAPLHTMYPGSVWRSYPSAGFEVVQRLLAEAPIQFGQLCITPLDVRHIADQQTDNLTLIDSPADLRRTVRENPLRPLPTSDDLPHGWHILTGGSAQRLMAVIETIYPGVLGITRQVRKFGLNPQAWQAVIDRETGSYRALQDFSPDQRARVVEKICAHCILSPLWTGESAPQDGPLCREPCSIWLAEAAANQGSKG